jgi:ADP-ribose pyrophosphatase YjhB (NUDIX family)
MSSKLFNVRVYGILIHNEALLVADEYIAERYITKLPGGGLEFGEGTIDCLAREFKEETGIEVIVDKHFYTTDFFQPSAFKKKQQVISIYYYVKTAFPEQIVASAHKYEGLQEINNTYIFRWLPLKDLTIGEFTLPIDQKVAALLIHKTI